MNPIRELSTLLLYFREVALVDHDDLRLHRHLAGGKDGSVKELNLRNYNMDIYI